MKRDFLMLCHVFDSKIVDPSAWYCSEKLDGARCFFDGGASTGMYADEIPWANTAKDGRYINRLPATGLWSRYGKPIQAPDWFIERLPKGVMLDGELWAGRGRFQDTMKITKQLTPDIRWRDIEYKVIDSPAPHQVFYDSEITLKKRYEKRFSGILPWLEKRGITITQPRKEFSKVLKDLKPLLEGRVYVKLHEQFELPYAKADAIKMMESRLMNVLEEGGEGLVLRNPSSFWIPQRVRTCLKYKPENDSEGIVTGYYWGRETDLGSKLLGMMGALEISWNDKIFKLSGFTDQERMMAPNCVEGLTSPGERVSNDYHNPTFPRGTVVTFTYRELTDDGVPKEARYFRKREDE